VCWSHFYNVSQTFWSVADRLIKQPISVGGRVIWSINPDLLQIIIIFCITTFLHCSSSFSGFMIILRFEIYCIKIFLLDAKTKRWNYRHWFSFKLFFQLLVLYFLNGKGGKINNKSFWHFSCMNLYLLRNWHTQVVCHQWIWGEKNSRYNSSFEPVSMKKTIVTQTKKK